MLELGIAKILSTFGLGFLLGVEHALDADHIAAVSTLVSRHKNIKKSSLLGAIWGMGHTMTLLLVGIAVLLFKLAIPAAIALSFEFIVGIMLVVLGISVLREVWQKKIHFHVHAHDGQVHAHFHEHAHDTAHFHSHLQKTFIIGLVHGLAGSAALLLVVLATTDSVAHGITSILLFGLGSVLGMLILGGIISLPFIAARQHHAIHTAMRATAGIVSVILGLVIIVDIGSLGLF